MAMKNTGKSPGLTLRNDGGAGMLGGSLRAAPAMADCTSCAAASMLRSSANCKVIWVSPCALTELMESTPSGFCQRVR